MIKQLPVITLLLMIVSLAAAVPDVKQVVPGKDHSDMEKAKERTELLRKSSAGNPNPLNEILVFHFINSNY